MSQNGTSLYLVTLRVTLGPIFVEFLGTFWVGGRNISYWLQFIHIVLGLFGLVVETFPIGCNLFISYSEAYLSLLFMLGVVGATHSCKKVTNAADGPYAANAAK